MKITIEEDDGKETVHQGVTDIYVALRKMEPVMSREGQFSMLPETRSWSIGGNLRELVKELRQSLLELEDTLRTMRGLEQGTPTSED
jgi:hypothetical protein